MASTTSDSAAAVARWRKAQLGITTLLLRDLRGMRRIIDPARLQATVPAWIEAVAALVARYSEVAATLAADFYDGEREAAGVSGAFTVPLADGPPSEQVDASLRWATKDLWPRAEADATAAQLEPFDVRLEAAFTKADGVADRLVLNSGRDTVLQAVNGDPRAVAWARGAALGCCSFCALMASRGATYRTAGTAGQEANARFKGDTGEAKFHNYCVPAGTLVDGPSAELGYRRQYEGEMLVIGTAAGHELRITPNHPVLTDRGWVPAGLLRPGDCVLSSLNAQGSLWPIPDEQHVPALAEDVWRALSVVGLVGVPGSAEDFHGDGAYGEVDVVGADGFLGRDGQGRVEMGGEDALACAGVGERPFPANGSEDALLFGDSTTADGSVGSGRLSGALLDGEPGHAVGVRFTSAANRHARLLQAAADDYSFHAIALGQREFARASHIRGDDLSVRKGFADRPRFNPSGLYVPRDGGGSYASRGRDLGHRLAGRVERDQIVDLRRVEFSGHVFNFQTSEGWYRASGVIVSNCRCVIVPVFRGQQFELSPHAAEWDRLYREHAQGHPGEQLRLFRRAFAEHQRKLGRPVP